MSRLRVFVVGAAFAGAWTSWRSCESARWQVDVPAIAAHERVGERTSTVATASSSLPIFSVADERAMRDLIRACETAGRHDIGALRRMALESSDPCVAGCAVRALGRLLAVASDAELVALAGDSRANVRQQVLLAIGDSGERSRVPELARATHDPDPEVRAVALLALGRLGGADAREQLERVSRGPSASAVERAVAVRALSVPTSAIAR